MWTGSPLHVQQAQLSARLRMGQAQQHSALVPGQLQPRGCQEGDSGIWAALHGCCHICTRLLDVQLERWLRCLVATLAVSKHKQLAMLRFLSARLTQHIEGSMGGGT